MDERRFDSIVRTVAAGRGSRRRILQVLGGGAGAAVLGRLGLGEAAAAKCVVVGEPCKRGRQCCSGVCAGKKGKKKCRDAGSAGTCQPDQDFCTSGDFGGSLCNDARCLCLRTAGGEPFCGRGLACAGCLDDADCFDFTGEGSVCIASGVHCLDCAGTGSGNLCVAPCPRR